MDEVMRRIVQDIAVVPFLVLLPIVENSDMTSSNAMDLISQLGPTALTTVGSLGLLLLAGRTVLRRVFQVSTPIRSFPGSLRPFQILKVKKRFLKLHPLFTQLIFPAATLRLIVKL